MPLYALDQGEIIHAADAESTVIYICAECHKPLKKRQGKHRFAHFYHLKSSPSCRLYSKPERHLLAQLQLQRLFPDGALQLERPFPNIGRIADLCWEEQKITFEIQCSPLSEKEAAERTADYLSIGYEPIWLLDDLRYNQRLLHRSEHFLRQGRAFYFAIFQNIVYDQFEIISGRRRIQKSQKLKIDLRAPYRKQPHLLFKEFVPLQVRSLNAPLFFRGDRVYSALYQNPLPLLQWSALEKRAQLKKERILSRFWKYCLLRPYVHWLNTMLDG